MDLKTRSESTTLPKNPNLDLNSNLAINAPVRVYPTSRYLEPIDTSIGRLSGKSRVGGDATPEVKFTVAKLILDLSANLSEEQQVSLLTIASIESGFNPDAASPDSSAAGIFQIVKRTAASLDLKPSEVFEPSKNILAGIRLFQSNRQVKKELYVGRSTLERALLDYALHHDGPGLNSGGLKIAPKRVPQAYAAQKAFINQLKKASRTN